MTSRNKREGWYAGRFRPSGASRADTRQPRRHRRQPYGFGCFITLREYRRLQRAAARLGVLPT